MRRVLPILAAALFIGACTASMTQMTPARGGGGAAAGPAPENSVWVCHQGRWQRVAEDAAGGHRRHGDAVSEEPREGSC